VSAQTRDDTWAEAVVANGDSSAAGVISASHPMRHVLTNVVGAREHAEIHISERPVHDGEVLLLCSDGVHNVLDDEVLARLLTATQDAETLAHSVVAAAIERGTRDNVTALVVRYEHDTRA
jgi:protein phosphatase